MRKDQRDGLLSRIGRYIGEFSWGPQASDAPAVQAPDEILRMMDLGRRSRAGMPVTEGSSMRVASVYACVKVIAEDISSLPLGVYEDKGDAGKSRADDHGVYRLLQRRPNERQTAMEFREMLTAHALLKGAGYAFKSMVRGRVDELIPLMPSQVTPRIQKDLSLMYEVRPMGGGTPRLYSSDQLLVVGGLSLDGYTHVGVVEYARDTIGLAQAQQAHESDHYRDGGVARIALKHPGILGGEKIGLSANSSKRMAESWAESFGVSGSFAKPVVLEEGVTVEKVGLTAQELQFVEGRGLSIEDICRFFRLSPHKIAHLAKMTNNNIEQLALDHVTSTLTPWAVRWEQAIQRDLIGTESPYYAKHNFAAQLRGDPEKRGKFYASGRQWGWLSSNDVRREEDKNPIKGGDDYLVPMNMRSADAPMPLPGAAIDQKPDPLEDPTQGEDA